MCNVVGCDKRAVNKGLCPLHYQMYRQGQDLDLKPDDREPEHRCNVTACGRTARSNGLCLYHLRQSRRRNNQCVSCGEEHIYTDRCSRCEEERERRGKRYVRTQSGNNMNFNLMALNEVNRHIEKKLEEVRVFPEVRLYESFEDKKIHIRRYVKMTGDILLEIETMIATVKMLKLPVDRIQYTMGGVREIMEEHFDRVTVDIPPELLTELVLRK